jgi:THO complex subunit 2
MLTNVPGRFLCRILSDLWKWFQDEAAFAADNYVKVAGKSSVLPGLVAKWASKDPEPSVRSVWENFKNFVKKWYRSLAKVSVVCI